MLDKQELLSHLSSGDVLPDRRDEYDNLPFRFMKSESLYWVFENVQYYQEQDQRQPKGRSVGLSFRVLSGLWLRTGLFSGKTQVKEVNVHVDTGLLGITTKHIYFAGPETSFRVRHDKLVSVVPYNDGFGIVRDTSKARPETFLVEDAEFAYRLLTGIQVD